MEVRWSTLAVVVAAAVAMVAGRSEGKNVDIEQGRYWGQNLLTPLRGSFLLQVVHNFIDIFLKNSICEKILKDAVNMY